MMKEGLFITFEGIDGCGKTTQIAKAEQYLVQKGVSCFVTREPGGTRIGEKIRDLILSTENREMKNSCELLLYLAARAQHVEEKILPALLKGITVLCDRYQEATFAYQGFGRGYPLDILQRLNKFASSELTPKLTFVFDISVGCAFERIKKSGKKPDRLEKSSMDFYQRIREGYLALASSYPKRIVLLQGDKPVDEIFSAVKKELDTLFSVSA